MAEEWFGACRDHVERLTALYAWAAAQYAACAMELASRVADGQAAPRRHRCWCCPPTCWPWLRFQVPRLQIPDRAVAQRWLARLSLENAGLAGDHERLVAEMAAWRARRRRSTKRRRWPSGRSGLVETEFPAASHKYAASRAFALTIMSAPAP
ncbi:MAG TPA: hypothetical protein VFB74_29725 [Kribbellaceae bacterium]|nr:hypothetical protein [Kribbellaceae bacterium]